MQVIRSHRRRTLSLELKAHQPIVVRTNKKTSRREIEQILQEKENWLEKNLNKLNRLPKLEPLQLRDGDHLYYLGRKLPIRRSVTTLKSAFLAVSGDHVKLLLPQGMWNENLSPETAQQILRQFYLREARKNLPDFFWLLSERTKLRPAKLRIGFMRTRWGSCSSQGRISLNSKIMAAPQWVIESVIVHELCHLKHMNHSKSYWQLANHHFDRHDAADKWLHEHLS